MIATPRAILGRISVAEGMHLFAVALRLVLDHLHELVQAPFILHVAVQPLDSYAGFPRFLHHRWLRPSAEDDSVFSRSGQESRGFGQEVALLSPFLFRCAKNRMGEISGSPRPFLALAVGERDAPQSISSRPKNRTPYILKNSFKPSAPDTTPRYFFPSRRLILTIQWHGTAKIS